MYITLVFLVGHICRCFLSTTYKSYLADCDYFLDKQSWAFVFSEEPECIELRLNSSFYRYLAMLCIVGSLDMASFVRFHQLQVSQTDGASHEEVMKEVMNEVMSYKLVPNEGMLLYSEITKYITPKFRISRETFLE